MVAVDDNFYWRCPAMTESTNNIGYVYLLGSRLSSTLVNIINLTFEKYPLNLPGFQSFLCLSSRLDESKNIIGHWPI